MYHEHWIQIEAHFRQREAQALAARIRLADEARAIEKARQPKRPGLMAGLLVRLGRFIEASGLYLQQRFGSPAAKSCCNL
jgi:hypothetical protein